MWPVLFTVAVVALVAALIACVWFAAQRKALIAERDRLAGDVQQRESAIEGYLDEVERLRNADGEKARQLAKLEGIDDKFKTLAQDVLRQVNEQFQQWAKGELENEQREANVELDKRKQAIEALLKPVNDSLEKHAKAVTEIEKSREGAYHALRQQIADLGQRSDQLRSETGNLVTALRRPEVRGRWGEIQLRRVAELAGMIENCDFTEQDSIRTSDGLLRPDMTVRLPSNRSIIVDAKTPLDAFLSALECQEDAQRQQFMERHADQIEAKVKDLSAKQYMAQFSQSPDFVVLFIPGESFLQAAVQCRPRLIEDAMEKGVLIATPSTLIALLKAVAMGWREQRLTENARQISELGKELHSRLATVFAHLTNLRAAVSKTVEHFNKLVGSLESSVLPQARRFQELGADSPKELPAQLDQIDTQPREPMKIEAQASES